MRQLVIDTIRGSTWYYKMIQNGLEGELPILEVQTDEFLLELYVYCSTGVKIR